MDPEAAIGYTWKLETVINKLKDENIIGTYASMDIDDAYGEGNSIFNDEGE